MGLCHSALLFFVYADRLEEWRNRERFTILPFLQGAAFKKTVPGVPDTWHCSNCTTCWQLCWEFRSVAASDIGVQGLLHWILALLL
jgi:hypothetical protein